MVHTNPQPTEREQLAKAHLLRRLLHRRVHRGPGRRRLVHARLRRRGVLRIPHGGVPRDPADPRPPPLGIDDLPNKRFDTIIQGRASYDVALREGITSPYAHLREYVASRTLKESPDPHVEIIAQDLVGKVRELKAEDGELGIYLCGGSQLAGELLGEIDELVVKTYPQVYGSGMPMFGAGFSVTDFTLESVRMFGNGVLVRTYARGR